MHGAAVAVVVLLAAVTAAEEKCSAEIKTGIQKLYEAFRARDAGDGGGIGKVGLSIIVDGGVVSRGNGVINVMKVDDDDAGADGTDGIMDSVDLVKAKYVFDKLKTLIGDTTVGANVRGAADNDERQTQPDEELTAAAAAADVPSSQVESHGFGGCSADVAMSTVEDCRESTAAVHGTPEPGHAAAAVASASASPPPPPPSHAAIDQLEHNFLDALTRIERLREPSPAASAAAVAAASAGAVPSSVPGNDGSKKAGKRRHLGRASKQRSHVTPSSPRRSGRFLNLFKFNKSRGSHNAAAIAATVAAHV